MSSIDLDQAEAAMNAFHSSVGTNDAMWEALELVAQTGGALTTEQVLSIAVEDRKGGREFDAVSLQEEHERPWRWWRDAARVARENDRPLLTGRIFLFARMFRDEYAPEFRPNDWLTINMGPVRNETMFSLAADAFAALAMSQLEDEVIVAGNQTGTMDVGAVSALAAVTLQELAEQGYPVPGELLAMSQDLIDYYVSKED